MLWTSTDTLARRSAFCMTATTRTASTTPGIVPDPPKMLTPPSSTTVTTVRVMPWPASARALDSRDGQDDAGERGDQAGQHEQADLDAGDADAGEPGRAGVLADGVDLPADPRPVEDDAEDDGQREEDDERPRDQRPGNVPEADLREPGREVADAARSEDDQREAAEERQRAERHDQRRQPAARDEQCRSAGRRGRRRRARPGSPTSSGTPAAHRKPRSALASPAIDSTDRSISPAMMISVIGRAMIATSMRAAIRFEKLPGVRKNGDSALPSDDQPDEGDDAGASPSARAGASSERRRSPEPRVALIGLRLATAARWIRRRMTASALTATRMTRP